MHFFCFSQQQEKIWRTDNRRILHLSLWRNSRKWIYCWWKYPAIQKKISVAVDKAYPPVDKSDSEWIKLLVNLDQSSEYKDHVLTYISGYIQKCLIVNESCHLCLMHLENEKFLNTCKLIEMKNRGGLTKANYHVIKVVKF